MCRHRPIYQGYCFKFQDETNDRPDLEAVVLQEASSFRGRRCRFGTIMNHHSCLILVSRSLMWQFCLLSNQWSFCSFCEKQILYYLYWSAGQPEWPLLGCPPWHQGLGTCRELSCTGARSGSRKPWTIDESGRMQSWWACFFGGWSLQQPLPNCGCSRIGAQCSPTRSVCIQRIFGSAGGSRFHEWGESWHWCLRAHEESGGIKGVRSNVSRSTHGSASHANLNGARGHSLTSSWEDRVHGALGFWAAAVIWNPQPAGAIATPSIRGGGMGALGFSGGFWRSKRAHRKTATPQGQPRRGPYTDQILKTAPSPEARQRIHEAQQKRDAVGEEHMVSLLAVRQRLAKLRGYESWAHWAQRDALFTSPQNVQSFLDSAWQRLRPGLETELHLLSEEKQSLGQEKDLHAWDVPYFLQRCRQKHTEADEISEFLTYPNLVKGVELILSRLLGLSFTQEEPEAGELWHPSVQKYAIRDEKQILGILYLDPFQRPGKRIQSAQFTLQGSKLLDDGRQTPKTCLVYALPPAVGRLTASFATTFMHEIGHAVHSLLSETQFQHLSGTRGTIDFVEPLTKLADFKFQRGSEFIFECVLSLL